VWTSPEEAVYQHQFSTIVLRAVKGTICNLFYEVNHKDNSDDNNINFLLHRPKEGEKLEYRIGIELTASVNQASLYERTAREYPVTKKVDQYVGVNISPVSTNPEFSTFSHQVKDEKGGDVLRTVLIFHVLHDREYKSVKLYRRNSDGQVVVVQIL
jgi:hypothetical protein